MNSFYTALSAVAPMFVMLALGYFARRKGMLDEKTLSQMNRLCFRVFLALNVFYNIYKVDIGEIFNPRLILWTVISTFIVLGISVAIGFSAEKGKNRRGALAHCIFHTNSVIFGTLIGTALCGEDNVGPIMLIIAVIVPVQNILSVILLEYSRGGASIDIKDMALSVVKNPYIVAAFLGFAVQLAGIRFPGFIANIFRDLGRCGTPVALIAMGGLFNFGAVKSNLRSVLIGCAGRLAAVPAVLIPLTLQMGFRGAEFVGFMCMFIAPVATTSFNLATQMDSDEDLTSQMVVFSSLGSLLTIFLWIFALSGMGIF